MELLRLISMVMVTTLHALGKSDLLPTFVKSFSANGWVAWILEVLSIGAVNIFMLISGYFLVNSEFKIRRLIELICQTVLYSAIPFLIFLIAGRLEPGERDIYHMLNSFLPVHMDTYWFITAYVVVYMLSPVITKGLKAISQKQLITVITALLIYECIFKSLLPFRLTADTKGNSFLWYLIVFLIGAYFRLYGFKLINSVLKGLIVYFGGSVLILGGLFAIGRIVAATDRLGGLQEVFLEYNHIFTIIAAIGIFAAFLHMKPMNETVGKVICFISPMALGVYLFQESPVLRYEWQKWFGLPGAYDSPLPLFIIKILAAVLGMFIMGIIVDLVRRVLFELIYMLIDKIKARKEPEISEETEN